MRHAQEMSTFDTMPLDLARPRFEGSGDAFVEWIRSLRAAGVRRAGPALLLALDALRQADLSPSRRFSVLRQIKSPVLKTCAGLPKPRSWFGGSAASTSSTRGLTAEQRLYRLMFQNFNQALRQLDRCYSLLDGRQLRRREWAVRNLFKFFDRQIRYSALWGSSMPDGAWRDLHELYVYLTMRANPPAGGDERNPVRRQFDPEHEYKRILLFGFAAERTPFGARDAVLLESLRQWASQTDLEDPQSVVDTARMLTVGLSDDAPPRFSSVPLPPDFRGWVLRLPEGFLERLDHPADGAPAKEVEMSRSWSLVPRAD